MALTNLTVKATLSNNRHKRQMISVRGAPFNCEKCIKKYFKFGKYSVNMTEECGSVRALIVVLLE